MSPAEIGDAGASMVIGGITLLILGVFFLLKWIISAFAGSVLVTWFIERRRIRREEDRRKEQDR